VTRLGCEFANRLFDAVVPPAVVIITLAVPTTPGGVTAKMVVLSTIVNSVTGTPAMVIPVAPSKLAPVIVMVVPPLADAEAGDTLLTVGAPVIVNV
jgi:hypothetical protein